MKIFRNIRPEFTDERGAITKILEPAIPMKSILIITSKANAIRSNHYHKNEEHYCYLVSGKMEWMEKSVEGGKIESAVLGAGDMVHTPPMSIHAVRFLEDSVLLVLSSMSRSYAGYEEDTVRIKLIE